MTEEYEAILARTEQAARELNLNIAKLEAVVHMMQLQKKIMENYK